MRIEVAQIQTDPGDIEGNTQKIISRIKEAKKKGTDLIVFPESTLTGYNSMDLLLYKEYLQDNHQALQQIIDNSEGIAVIAGYVDYDPNQLGPDGTPVRYNCAAGIENRRIQGIAVKSLIPTYDVFSEVRYFTEASRRKVIPLKGIKVGLEVCEDTWDQYYPIDVSGELVKQGAQLLINISASPFYVGKRFDREKAIQRIIQKYHRPFVYATTVGTQDGYDGELVFDGQSMVFNSKGELIRLGKAFAEDSLTVDFPFEDQLPIEIEDYNPTKELHDALVLGIKDYFRRSGFKKAFIGLSGGIDSAVVAALATKALGAENITGISMPSHISNTASVEDARELAKNLGINFQIIPIEGTRQSLSAELTQTLQKDPADLTNQNIQARIRGMILMAYANEKNGLVLSTGNKTETALGYCTLYGDMAGGLAVIQDVDKLKVYALARYINCPTALIPQHSIDAAPTAGLTLNQTDEESLGAPYEVIVPIVNRLIEERATIKEVSQDYPRTLVEKYWDLITHAEHKRRQAPPGIKVTSKAFGIGRRIPMNHKFRR